MSQGLVERLERMENKIDELIERVSALEAKAGTTKTLIKWVVFPLLCILGALIGLKLGLPG